MCLGTQYSTSHAVNSRDISRVHGEFGVLLAIEATSLRNASDVQCKCSLTRNRNYYQTCFKCNDRNHFAIILRYNHRAASSHRNLPQHRPQHRDPRFHYQSSEGERCLLQIWLHFQRHNFHGCKKVSCTVMILEPRGSRIITSKKVLYYWELRFARMSLLTYFRVLMLPAGRNCYWKLSVELIVILSAELYFTLSWLFQ